MTRTDSNDRTAGLPSLLLQLWGHLGINRRFQLLVLLLVMLASSLAEVISLTAVLPFLAVLADPKSLTTNPSVVMLLGWTGLPLMESPLLPVSVAFATAALSAGCIRILNLWLCGRLSAAIGSDLSSEAFRRTLNKPYTFHLKSNSSDLITSITTDVQRVINVVISPLLSLLSSTLIAFGLVVALILINWTVAISSALVIIFVYAITTLSSSRPLLRLSILESSNNRLLLQTIQEGLGAIRDVLLDSTQHIFCLTYQKADRPLRRAQAASVFLTSYPRLLLEPIGLVVIAAVGYLFATTNSISSALPLLGSLALGAQRLLPVMQKIYEGWACTRAGKQSLNSLLTLLSPSHNCFDNTQPISPVVFHRSVKLENVQFSYSDHLPSILTDVNLEIICGDKIGIVGTTGSGKSTLIDIIMGLIRPTSGRITIDGFDMYDRSQPDFIRRWGKSISHVPQSIYLTDSTIASNIAFGVPDDDIDYSLLEHVSEQAQIAQLIRSMPNQYQSVVGERGTRLSGGQRQRIAIARALYKKPKVLILDEATSALDSTTEQAVMNSIQHLNSDMTIVMVAHRISTLSLCNRIFRIDNGVIENFSLPSDT